MAKLFAIAFYKSAAWQHCRAAYIASVFNLCERCRKPGKILHHKKPLTPDNITDPEITLGFDNLRYLCHECHEAEHNDTYVTRKDVRFDERGNLVQTAPPIDEIAI